MRDCEELDITPPHEELSRLAVPRKDPSSSWSERQLLVEAINSAQDAYAELGRVMSSLGMIGEVIKAHGQRLDGHDAAITKIGSEIKTIKSDLGIIRGEVAKLKQAAGI